MTQPMQMPSFGKTQTEFTRIMYASTTEDTPLSKNTMTGNLTEDLPTFMEEVEAHMTYTIATYIKYYWFPILAPVGVVGNALFFLVMIKPNNRKVSTCIYMAAISVNDNLVMCLAFYGWFIGVDIFQWHTMNCKSMSFLTTFAMQNSRYTVLAMTIDKYIAIKWPHKGATYSIPRKVKSILSGVLTFTILYNVRHIFMTSLVRGRCRAYVVGHIIKEVLTWLSFLVNGFIPFSLLIYMNYVIVKTITLQQ